VSEPQKKKRPSALWLLFYGRQRRGFPWLLFWIGVGVLVGALTFRLVGGPELWRDVFPIFAGVLIVASLLLAVVAVLIPRRRR
jgi:hypothetical protein